MGRIDHGENEILVRGLSARRKGVFQHNRPIAAVQRLAGCRSATSPKRSFVASPAQSKLECQQLSGELPFPELGGWGAQGTLPLSMRALPMTSPADGSVGSEADVEAARHAADGQSSEQTHLAPKKTALVVQAVIAGEQRQMEMDFEGPVAAVEAASAVGEAQMRSAVDGLDDMEATLRQNGDHGLTFQ